MTYALDTNAIIHYLNGRKTVTTKFLSVATSNTPIVIPFAINYEVVRGFYHTSNSEKENIYNQLKIFCPIIALTPDMWDRAAQIWAKLRKMNRNIGDADLLIASQCIINEYTLVTENRKHFDPVVGLNIGLTIENWAEK